MTRTTPTVAACALALLLGASHARAGFINGFDNGTGYTVNSFTTFGSYSPLFSGPGGNTVQLTTTTVGPMGSSLFYNAAQDITQFSVQFTYQTSGGGDGFAFVLQNDPRGASAIGGAGGNMGYGNLEGPSSGHTAIGNSVALLFNIWSGHQQGTELVTDGTIDFGYSSVSPVILDNNTPIQVTLTYDGSNLTELLTQGSNTYTRTYAGLDLAGVVGRSTAYVGFSGGAGGFVSDQFVSNFTFDSPSAVPAPPSLVLGLIAGGVLGGWRLLRRWQSKPSVSVA